MPDKSVKRCLVRSLDCGLFVLEILHGMQFVFVGEEYAFEGHPRVHLRHSLSQTSRRVKLLLIEI